MLRDKHFTVVNNLIKFEKIVNYWVFHLIIQKMAPAASVVYFVFSFARWRQHRVFNSIVSETKALYKKTLIISVVVIKIQLFRNWLKFFYNSSLSAI